MLLGIITSDYFLDLSIISFIAFLGSFSKVYLKVIQTPEEEIGIMNRIIEIFLSTITATVMVFTFSEKIKSEFTMRGIIFFSYVTGLLGYELLNRISSVKGFMSLLASTLEFYRYAQNANSGKGIDPDLEKYIIDDDEEKKARITELKYRWKTEEEIEREKEQNK